MIGGEWRRVVLRCFPYGVSMVAANVHHYSSLWKARESAARRVKARKRLLVESYLHEHEPLTFDLMTGPEMRRARYKIKLVRYMSTWIYLLLFYKHIEELQLQRFELVSWITLEALVTGLLTGVLTLYLDENREQQMRTLWNPGVDFNSRRAVIAWDCLRFTGGCLAVPVEEELFYHSWLYRYMYSVTRCCYSSFVHVPFWKWSWPVSVASNGLFAAQNGMEWKSCLLSGLMFQWMIAWRGEFLHGVFAHLICNLTISLWVVLSGQRHYW